MNRIVSAAIMATAMLASVTTAIAPAAAQPAPGYARPGGWDRDAFWRGAPAGPRERIAFLQERVDRGRADGSLNRREASRVNGELNAVRSWARRMHYYDAGPLDPRQVAMLQDRLDRISQQIRWLRHNGW